MSSINNRPFISWSNSNKKYLDIVPLDFPYFLRFLAICVKSKFEKSYKDIPDEKFTEVVDYIEYLKRSPS